METRQIGSLKVPLVGLGCNNFGGRIDEAATREVVDAAIDAGATFFDTADIYGATRSEEFLGRILRGRRRHIVLATKFGHEVSPDKKGARPEYVKQACEDSLRRLETDVIDLYQLHRPDDEVPIADTLGALDGLVREGKVREIGCSNFTSDMLREAQTAASGARFVSVQNEYSLFHREPEAGVLDTCLELDIAFIPYFPLASGLLTGKYRKGQPSPEGTRIKPGSDRLSEANLNRVEALAAFAEREGRTLLELAMSWLAGRPAVASIIAGATKADQVRANVAAIGWAIGEARQMEIDAILSQ
jgi:aryl-alcohol dehydrogenase-like predicted oxidoreductase